MAENFKLSIGKPTHDVSPLLFGLFLEDINWACDGGLNANMVQNHSFDGVYIQKNYSEIKAGSFKKPPKILHDRLRYWTISDGSIESRDDSPVSETSFYARINADGKGYLKNNGYNGGKKFAGQCAMNIVSGHGYEFSCYIRNIDFDGKISVYAEDKAGGRLTDDVDVSFGKGWQKMSVSIKGKKDAYGRLVIVFDGKGSIDIDCVSFSDRDVWGKEDPKWSGGHFRKDLVETLKDLHPKFLRFPGGCIVEGLYGGNEYHWKDSIGDLINRKENTNLWSIRIPDGGYNQSYQIGFYEFFLLCENLKMEPLPTVWAGFNCQFRSKRVLETNSKEFEEEVVQNALNLIEYANGDPKNSKWAKLRADAGHPQPFGLKMIGIGNENFGEDYLEKFEIVKKAIDEKYPEITCILSAGASLSDKNFELAWARSNEKMNDVRIDEHFYEKPDWVLKNDHRYDNYDRNKAKVFLGEYAANEVLQTVKCNSFKTALAEAAFLTGIERNSDVVAMSSYAPLFSLCGGEQWKHNLINFNPKNVLKTANYFVQQMYSSTVGDRVLEIKGVLPKGIYASATETEEKKIIKLANTNRSAVTAEISFGTNAESVEITCLQSDDLKAVNKLSFDGQPQYEIQPQKSTAVISSGKLELRILQYGFYVIEICKSQND